MGEFFNCNNNKKYKIVSNVLKYVEISWEKLENLNKFKK